MLFCRWARTQGWSDSALFRQLAKKTSGALTISTNSITLSGKWAHAVWLSIWCRTRENKWALPLFRKPLFRHIIEPAPKWFCLGSLVQVSCLMLFFSHPVALLNGILSYIIALPYMINVAKKKLASQFSPEQHGFMGKVRWFRSSQTKSQRESRMTVSRKKRSLLTFSRCEQWALQDVRWMNFFDDPELFICASEGISTKVYLQQRAFSIAAMY